MVEDFVNSPELSWDGSLGPSTPHQRLQRSAEGQQVGLMQGELPCRVFCHRLGCG